MRRSTFVASRGSIAPSDGAATQVLRQVRALGPHTAHPDDFGGVVQFSAASDGGFRNSSAVNQLLSDLGPAGSAREDRPAPSQA